jgi:hypothetical protein
MGVPLLPASKKRGRPPKKRPCRTKNCTRLAATGQKICEPCLALREERRSARHLRAVEKLAAKIRREQRPHSNSRRAIEARAQRAKDREIYGSYKTRAPEEIESALQAFDERLQARAAAVQREAQEEAEQRALREDLAQREPQDETTSPPLRVWTMSRGVKFLASRIGFTSLPAKEPPARPKGRANVS